MLRILLNPFTSLTPGKAVGGVVYDDFSPYRGPTVSQCKVEIISIVSAVCTVNDASHNPAGCFSIFSCKFDYFDPQIAISDFLFFKVS